MNEVSKPRPRDTPSSMDQIVLSYHDSLIRQSDYLLLDAPNWLNDKVIGFYFE